MQFIEVVDATLGLILVSLARCSVCSPPQLPRAQCATITSKTIARDLKLVSDSSSCNPFPVRTVDSRCDVIEAHTTLCALLAMTCALCSV